MFFKTKNVKASYGVSAGKASSALKSHLKYLQYRERDQQKESRQDRHLFDKERDRVDRKDAHDDVMKARAGTIYYHRMVLSPSNQEPVTDWRVWARDVMADLERHLGTDLHWYATIHQNTDNPHVHVVLRGTGENCATGNSQSVELTPVEFKIIKESGRNHSEYEHYQQIQDIFKELDHLDTLEHFSETEHTLSIHQQPTYDFGR
jgi:hypothetical protein